MADRQIVAALSPFQANNAAGVPFMVRADDLFWSDDPIVAANPAAFGPPMVRDSAEAIRRVRPIMVATETAVAPPSGQRRAAVTQTGKAMAAAGSPAVKRGPRPEGEV